MRTTCLRYPKVSRFIQIHEWQLEATGGNQAAAGLLSMLEWRHNHLIENRDFERVIAAALKFQKKTAPLEFRGWQFYTDAELEKKLLLWKKEAILTGVRKLVELGFIETEPPEVLKSLFKTGRQKWFLFRADLVNRFLDDFSARHFPNGEQPAAPPAETPAEKKKRRAVSMLELETKAGESLMAQAREVFKDWKTVLDSPQSLEIASRLKLVIDRLKEGYAVERLKLASRGVVCLDYNMGFNSEGREHWRFDLIFRDGEHVEKYEAAALVKGLTVDNLNQFQLNRLNRQIRPANSSTESNAGAPALSEAFCLTAAALAFGIANYTEKDALIWSARETLAGESFDLEEMKTAVEAELKSLMVVDKSARDRIEKICRLLGEK